MELEKELYRMDAQESFPVFLNYIQPTYSRQWFHTLIARSCQRLFEGTLGTSKLMLFVPPQHGKALEITTPVLTANRGWIEHGSLREGDIVYAPNGSRVKVEAVTPHYQCECSEIEFAEGRSVIAANEHEWGCYIPDSNHKPVYHPRIETREICGKVKGRNPYLMVASSLSGEQKDLPIPPYLLGLWLGDGSSRNKQICKSLDDCEFFLSRYPGKVVRKKGNIAYITFNALNNTKLKQLGVFANKHIPREYLNADVSQRISLLQGIMDTDGYCDKRGNCEISQVNETLSEDICELVRGLGYKPGVLQGDAKLYGRIVSKKYRICFNPDKGDEVFSLPRKAERLRNKVTRDRADKMKHFIHKITPCGGHIVNCIQVEGGYYLVGKELRPTHNSEIVSRKFPAWELGRNPRMKIVGSSYSADLAQQFSRSIQRTIDSPEYHVLFPDTYLSGSAVRTDVTKGYLRNVDLFETVGYGGFYKAVGVGGSLTGTPVDLGIIDDPVKDAMEAYSVTYRERVWNWYTDVFLTRLHNGSKQLLIMTRWHEDDLAGRLLDREGDDWTVITIPAICEVENDGSLNSERHIGDALWEERHSLERLKEAEQRSPRTFAALYQQRPTIEGGNIIRRDWFGHVKENDFKRMHEDEPIIFFIDTAYTDKTSNDPTGIIATCKIGGDLYITHAQKVNMKFPELVRFIPEYVSSHGYTRRSTIRIEPKANGLSVIDQLQEMTGLNVTKTPSPTEAKETRLNAASPTVEGGRVILVDGAWNEAFIDEICGFPSKPHDEFVDLLCYAVDYHHRNFNELSDEEILRDFL